MKAGFRLATERLVLRRLETADLDDLASILADPVMMQYYPAPFSRRKTREWIETNRARYRHDGFGLWAMESKETGELLGDCGLVYQMVDGVREVEVGWHVARSHWRRGLATEAAAVCRDFAFGELGLDRIISLIRPENVPSRRVAEKLGMDVDGGTLRAGMAHLVYALRKDER